MAAASRYNPDYHDDWAWSLALKGATDDEVADAFHVSRRTILRWKKDHPSFAEAYQHGKDIADSKVEKSLYERALGYEYEESERVVDIDPKTGETKPVRVKTVKKKIAADTMAIMYWLNNRSKGKWSQTQEKTKDSSVVDDWINSIPDD